MSIPISSPEGKQLKDWVLVGVSCLAISGSFGLGMVAGKEQAAAEGPDDRMWIEQLPAEVRADPSRTSTSTGAGNTSAGAGEGSALAAVGAIGGDSGVQTPPVVQTGTYVASRTGTKYYLPTCATAKRIKEENRVWFATREDAAAAGYEPAANCKGM